MSTVNEISDFIDNLLNVEMYSNDPSNNGLQVKASDLVKKIGFGVDASLELFQKAAEDNCDMVVVHHGISWGNGFKKIVDDLTGKRITALFRKNLSLYAVHLPLDADPKYGHNATICRQLKLKNIQPFAEYAGYKIGFHGELETPVKLSELVKNVEQILDTECDVYGADPEDIVQKIGVASGGAADELADADKLGLDVYITGEMNHYHVHTAQELSPALITAGHYKTEVPGIKELMRAVTENFNLECKFYDLPTGL